MSPDRYPSEAVDPAPLKQPLKFEFSGRVARNRLLKAATTERLASWSRNEPTFVGIPEEKLINVYRRWGQGGYGVIVSGNIMVADDHLEAPGNMIIPLGAVTKVGDRRFDGFSELANVAKREGSLFVGQLNHPGRQTKLELQPNPVSPSDIPLENTLGMSFGRPHAASLAEIAKITHQFVWSSEYLYEAGFDGVQLHAAHGYLLAAFLSKTTNNRTDQYGGSLLNRCRLILEIVQGIRQKVPSSFIISIKLNSVEFQEGGLTPEEARELCTILQDQAQIDFVELSGGTYQRLAWEHQRESSRLREAFFLEFAEMITPVLTRTKSYVTGGFQTAPAMINALKATDGIGIARAACQEFSFGRHLLDGRINSAIAQRLDHQNFMLTNVAAGTQIGQVGCDENPIDLSVPENVDCFLKDMKTWIQRLGEDKDMLMQGYVNMSSVAPAPYNDNLI
ncbi:uncharacterized protein Z520_07752 [Fonsecaea multimorphosa CBS 102226]|uniref:NADH:flavin oxidoreductase/NADH oxidase N-terminal domain-containing protein n=1 Tax=Fonsecaea multimorphosa CBS 102226 TaxID=1442371 RepID=A0A0D2IHI7_9EURO|nr:uncharacterized protein Z520_07752 [Fonsecaea multimorphosa CBS 102226]KIX96486.1 hypothetical protein Z520_07752 [Fonsecaea multimorphosa CBS 102226]OAL28313.1 hypothetical protein AYO22_03019 [Fonsecaea multimorphosa]